MNEPIITVFDIETYGGLKAHMSEISVFGYKEYKKPGGAKILSGRQFKKEFKKDFTNDKPLLIELSKVWNASDAVIAHYGQRFDRRFLNSRIERHCLRPLKPVKLIDTWRISKDNFALPGNSLNTLLKYFNSPYQKVDLTYEEWRAVMKGEEPALKLLEEHCRYDVLGLDWVTKKHLEHYITALPNYNLFVDPEQKVCPYCGGKELAKEGKHYTQLAVWQQYSCKNPLCLKWPRGPIGKGGRIR